MSEDKDEEQTAHSIRMAIVSTDNLIDKMKANKDVVSSLLVQRNLLVGAMHLLAQGEAVRGPQKGKVAP